MTQSDTPPNDWPERLSASFGRHLQQARRTANPPLSAAGLAGRCAELGHGITRSQIANFESGRTVPRLPDVLVLAAALSVSLPWLITGAGAFWAQPTEVLPGVVASPEEAYGWASGRTRLDVLPEPENPETPDEWSRRGPAAALLVEHRAQARRWEQHHDPDIRGRLGWIRRMLRIAGAPAPPLPVGMDSDPADDPDDDLFAMIKER